MTSSTPTPKYILWHHTKRVGHWLGWRVLHLFFPGVVHYLTDKYEDKHHHLVIDTLYAVTAMTLIAVNVGLGIWWTKIFTPVEVNLLVELPTEVKANAPLDIQVTLNNGQEAVQNVSLLIDLPAGIEPTKSSHLVHTSGSNEHTLELALTDLQPNELRTVVIPAWNYGPIDESQKIRVFAQYEHFNQRWELAQGASVTPLTSNLTFSLNAPEHNLNDQPFDWQIKFQNQSNLPLSNLQFQLTIPQDLSVAGVDGGDFLADTKRITVPEVEAGAEGTVTVHSVFHETFDSNQQLSVEALIPSHDHQVFSQGSQDIGSDALRPRLSVLVFPNKTAVNLGETLYYTIDLKNVGDTELSQLEVTADLQGEAFNTSRAFGAGATQSGSKLVWVLDETVAPGESTQLKFSVPTLASLTDHNLTVHVVVNAQAIVSDIQVNTISQAVISEVKFNSNLSLTTQALYSGSSGEQFGYGPWPVEADTITAVRVFWSIKNVNNQVNSAVISSTLPGQVEWTGSSSVSYGNALTYNVSTRTVSWNVGSLPADGRTLGASFEVRVLPNYLQIGKIIRLTNETKLTAIDMFTGAYLTTQAEPVFTAEAVTTAE